MIRISFRDHNPPHLHEEYQDREALFDIRTGEVLTGRLPRKQTRMVVAWIELHRDALAENWALAYNKKTPFKIAGLDEA